MFSANVPASDRSLMIDGEITKIRKDASEDVNYNFPGFPAYVRRGLLSHYPDHSFISHWHDDLEFILVRSGRMSYNVNGDIVTLGEGDCIIVGSRQLHYGFSDTHSECDFLCILLHPMLFSTCPVMQEQYVTPLVEQSDIPYLLLHDQAPWERKLFSLLRRFYDASLQEHAILHMQSLAFQIWEHLFSDVPTENMRKKHHVSQQLLTLKDMIRFIQRNYESKITLSDIAEAGHICKSGCNGIFHHYLRKSPIAYLIEYRLQKSAELLRDTELSISEIASESGFADASYYTKTFREHYGLSPREFRRQKTQLPAHASLAPGV